MYVVASDNHIVSISFCQRADWNYRYRAKSDEPSTDDVFDIQPDASF